MTWVFRLTLLILVSAASEEPTAFSYTMYGTRLRWNKRDVSIDFS